MDLNGATCMAILIYIYCFLCVFSETIITSLTCFSQQHTNKQTHAHTHKNQNTQEIYILELKNKYNFYVNDFEMEVDEAALNSI